MASKECREHGVSYLKEAKKRLGTAEAEFDAAIAACTQTVENLGRLAEFMPFEFPEDEQERVQSQDGANLCARAAASDQNTLDCLGELHDAL
jgi:hypothetical protein